MDPLEQIQKIVQCTLPISERCFSAPLSSANLDESDMNGDTASEEIQQQQQQEQQQLDHILKQCLSEQCQIVLIGGATQGTAEFYRLRSEISKRLIEQYGFNVVAVEADWPDAYRVNRYVRTEAQGRRDVDAASSLLSFQSYPSWMWRNTCMVEFITWLREHNVSVRRRSNNGSINHNRTQVFGEQQQQQHSELNVECGFYGLDLFSLNKSRMEVIRYLRDVNPELAQRAERYYACFERFSNNVDTYSYKTGLGLETDCELSVLKVLNDMMAHQAEMMSQDDIPEQDAFFYAKMNAKVVANAESYFRNMLSASNNASNIRDRSMFDTLLELMTYLTEKNGGVRSKVIIWAHNSHVGDSRRTAAAITPASGSNVQEINLGQLVKSSFGSGQCFSMGFTTYSGSLTASSHWNGDPDYFILNEALPCSIEFVLHQVMLYLVNDQTPQLSQEREQQLQQEQQEQRRLSGNHQPSSEQNGERGEIKGFALVFHAPNKSCQILVSDEVKQILSIPKLQRMIGVIYEPMIERLSHYCECVLAQQFDSVIHLDATQASTPLDFSPVWIGKTTIVLDIETLTNTK